MKKSFYFALGVAGFVLLAILVLIIIPKTKYHSNETISAPQQEESTEDNRLKTFIDAAYAEVDTVGGAKYIDWYTGFDHEAAWCAIFVAWCAGQADATHDGTVPKYSLVMDYYKYYQNQAATFASTNYQPVPGDLAFFDWDRDGQYDHIGIVYEATETEVRIVNGNNGYGLSSMNIVKLSVYPYDNQNLAAYAHPNWN